MTMWRPLPLDYVVLEVLKKKGEGVTLTEKELYDEVVRSAGYEVPYGDFLRALMKLEMYGYISVYMVKENFRHITYLGEKFLGEQG